MIFIFIPFLLFAFEVEFNDTFTKFIIPQKKAINKILFNIKNNIAFKMALKTAEKKG